MTAILERGRMLSARLSSAFTAAVALAQYLTPADSLWPNGGVQSILSGLHIPTEAPVPRDGEYTSS
jgi:hypothetical protein